MSPTHAGDVPMGSKAVEVVDTDVHPTPAGLDAFIEHYPEPFRSRYFTQYKDEVPLGFFLYTPHSNLGGGQGMGGPGGFATPPGGGHIGSDPQFLAKQLLVDLGADYAIFNPLSFRPRHWDPEWDAAHCSAVNNWLAANWLEGKPNDHGRFFGGIQVSSVNVESAVTELEKWAEHPAFVQTYMIADSHIPFGHPTFEPLLKATAKYDLPIGTHLYRHSGIRSMTPVGFPSYHVEVLPNWIFTYIAHVTSMVFEGVFERYPNLKLMAIEGGCEWIAPLMWRLDRNWEALREEIPQTTRKPSDIIREHVRFATQPLAEPKGRNDLIRFMEWGGAEETIVYSSDYPHYDFDPAAWVKQQLPDSWRDRVMAGNALDSYAKLDPIRPLGYLDDMQPSNIRMDAGERRYAAVLANAAVADNDNAIFAAD